MGKLAIVRTITVVQLVESLDYSKEEYPTLQNIKETCTDLGDTCEAIEFSQPHEVELNVVVIDMDNPKKSMSELRD